MRMLRGNVCLLLVDGGQLVLVEVLGSLHGRVEVHGLLGQVLLNNLTGLANHLLLDVLLLLTSFHLGTALSVASAAVHATIPPVLDSVVAATAKAASDLGPALAHLGDHLLNQLTLLGSDGIMVEVGLQVLVVSLTALLGRASAHHARDTDPVVSALRVDKAHEDVILLLGPRTSLVCRHFEVSKD
jgi:hypothetical protein